MEKKQGKHPPVIIVIGMSGLLMLPVGGLSLSFWTPQVVAQQTNRQLSPEDLKQIAFAITVKIITGSSGGSGTIIRREGSVYTVLTNQHVLQGENNYKIQTSDGQIHGGEVVSDSKFGKKDLALLQFSSEKTYPVASFANLAKINKGDQIYTGGYPFENKTSQEREFVWVSEGRISFILNRPLEGGYGIGYTSGVEKGMSGGPVLTQQGQVIGINGLHARPLWGSGAVYIYEDGTQPSDQLRGQMEKSSWAIPIETVAKLAPEYFPKDIISTSSPIASNGTTSSNQIVTEVENIAKKVAVLVKWENSNGSGVIVGKQSSTYYVLTADHVAGNQKKSPLQIITHDGQEYSVTVEKRWPEVDLALLKFNSNQNYQIVTIADYAIGLDDQLAFVAGWPDWKKNTASNLDTNRQFNAGFLLGWAKAINSVSADISLSKGKGLVYTNITHSGMSGGPVLDAQGHLLGIHGAVEAVKGFQPSPIPEKNEADVKLNFGFSLGVPIRTFLVKVDQDKLNISLHKDTALPKEITKDEQDKVVSRSLNVQNTVNESDYNELLNYGNKLWRLGRYEQAEQALEKATNLKPDFYEAWYAKGMILMSQQKYQDAANSFKKVIEYADNSQGGSRGKDFTFYAWRELGDAFYYLAEYDQALAALDNALKIKPDQDFILYNWRATVLEAQGRYPEALGDSNKAIELNPDNAESYIRRAIIFADVNDYQQALADVNQAIGIQSDLALAHSYRGYLLSQQEGFFKQQVLADFNQAIELQPQDGGNYLRRGYFYAQIGERQKFLADFEQALRLLPDEAAIYQNRAQGYAYLNETERAIEDYNTAIRLAPESAYLFYAERGQIHLDQEDYPKAIADYSEAIRLRPNFVLAYLRRGKTYAQLNQKQKAIEDFNKAVSLMPKNSWIYTWRGDAYLILGETEKGIQDYETAISFTPELSHLYYFSRGNTRKTLGDYQGAIADYTEAIRLKPREARFYLSRGEGKEFGEDYQGAIADYTEAIRLQPTYISAYLRRGRTYARLKNQQMALQDYEQAIRINPEDAWIYSWRGDAYREWGENQKALQDYNQAIRLAPQNASLYLDRAKAWVGLDHPQAAIDDLTVAVSLQPNNPTFYYQRGSGKYNILQDYGGAIADLTRAIELKPHYAAAYNERGNVLFAQENYQAAIADYSQAISLAPQNYIYFGNRANSYSRLQQYQEAVSDYSQAISLAPQNLLYLVNRAITYFQLQQYQEAIADCNRAIEVNANSGDAYGYRGLSKAKIGEQSGAIADLQKAAQLFQQQGNEKGYRVALEELNKIQGGNNQSNNDPQIYLTQGDNYYNQKNYRAAKDAYTQVINLQPDNALAYFKRGLCVSELGEYQRAIADYNQVIRLEANFAQAYHYRGIAKDKLGEYQEAITDYNQALGYLIYTGVGIRFVDGEKPLQGMGIGEIFPNSPAAESNLKVKDQVLAINGQSTLNKNAQELEKMIGEQVLNQNIMQVTLLIKREGEREFEVKLSKGKIIHPDAASVYISRGNARQQLKDFQGAREDFQTAAQLYQQQNDTQRYQMALEKLRELQ